MAHLIKCLSYKSKDLRSDSNTTYTKLGKVACLYDSSSARAETGGWSLLVSQSSKPVSNSNRFYKRSSLS